MFAIELTVCYVFALAYFLVVLWFRLWPQLASSYIHEAAAKQLYLKLGSMHSTAAKQLCMANRIHAHMEQLQSS